MGLRLVGNVLPIHSSTGFLVASPFVDVIVSARYGAMLLVLSPDVCITRGRLDTSASILGRVFASGRVSKQILPHICKSFQILASFTCFTCGAEVILKRNASINDSGFFHE